MNPAAAPRGRRAANQPALPFARKLVLNQWLLGLFGVERFEQLAEHLRDETLEGLDENNVHRFHHALTAHFAELTQLPPALLLEYDQNIVSITQRLNDRRITRGEAPVVWKYFQYLMLLFTEIYLDRYFRDPQALLKAVNGRIATFNDGKQEADQITPFDETADAWPYLNEIAYWSATDSGMGAVAHLAAEMFKSMAGVSIVHIPYKSAGPALVDVIAGQNQLMFATSLSVRPHIKAAKLRALAVTTAKRSRLMPELPTIAEAGVPGFEAMTWHGVLTTGGTPPAIVNKLNAEINRILQLPDVRERLGALGAEIIGGTPKEFADHIQREIPKWAKVIKDAGVRLE